MAYSIIFDVGTNHCKDIAKIYHEIEKAMNQAGFTRLQNNLYRSEKDDINAVFDAVEALSTIEGFNDCVKSVYGFRIEGWSNLKKRIVAI